MKVVDGGAAGDRLPIPSSLRRHMVDVPGCLACDLTAGRIPVPGGPIHETDRWRVEHCVGPLGVGTLVVKPKRHVIRVSELSAEEAVEQGPLLARCAAVVDMLLEPEQTYVCLWSHAGGKPVHIHHVVQPVTRSQMDSYGAHGPRLQVEMFSRGELPSLDGVVEFARRARAAFAGAA
jgi:diadenosine tetraphosphate (Ap4A) HIT family hydrolase